MCLGVDGVALQEMAGYMEKTSSGPCRTDQKTPRSVSWCRTLKCAKGEAIFVEEGH